MTAPDPRPDDGEAVPGRRLVALEGADALPFLQGVVSADVSGLAGGPGLVWTALLTPQGKYLADFFVARTPGGALLLDLPEALAEGALARLALYRLRADVRFGPCALHPVRGLGPAPADALPDPRDPALGWRAWREVPGAAPGSIDWDAIRVASVVPEAGAELVPGESYILEMGFERLHGVSFRKGCYVGQEVTARMKHKTELRRTLTRLRITGAAPVGTTILAEGREAGRLGTQAGGRALAWMRLDRIAPQMEAGAATLAPE